ncbi:unnamed protein product [Oppiella nova]|uniref:Uncharacterized protein n=1 Tax=Oppiella nova TaxID=334625 RepID=A0A7R9QV58_9ACAR|nr:unnamed protein product [Oppiella nova]CAG2176748.1 unnamed protein product [Oppiella nova]
MKPNPRTGSTYLANLLGSHADIGLAGELLNDENIIPEDALKYISKELAKYDQKFVFPEQILKRKLRFDDIVRHIGADVVIVLWRKSIAEQLVSLRIAEKTGVWFEGAEEFISSQWPIDIIPIYVSYDDLIADPLSELRKIMSRLSCDSGQYVFASPGAVKQQFPPSERIENWEEIRDDLKILEINVKQLMTECIENNLNVKCQALPLVPDPEPPIPSKGWRYHVCAPYMPNEGKDNVIQALVSGSVSSAGFWPKEMSDKLRKKFNCPVAQPCSNGFTALMITFQAMHVGSGDEVIMPSMTMVAVPNSVTFVGAVPVFADCADGDYNPGLKEILEVASDYSAFKP